MRVISFIEDEGLSGRLLQEFKTAPGDPDGCDFCYLFADSNHSKT